VGRRPGCGVPHATRSPALMRLCPGRGTAGPSARSRTTITTFRSNSRASGREVTATACRSVHCTGGTAKCAPQVRPPSPRATHFSRMLAARTLARTLVRTLARTLVRTLSPHPRPHPCPHPRPQPQPHPSPAPSLACTQPHPSPAPSSAPSPAPSSALLARTLVRTLARTLARSRSRTPRPHPRPQPQPHPSPAPSPAAAAAPLVLGVCVARDLSFVHAPRVAGRKPSDGFLATNACASCWSSTGSSASAKCIVTRWPTPRCYHIWPSRLLCLHRGGRRVAQLVGVDVLPGTSSARAGAANECTAVGVVHLPARPYTSPATVLSLECPLVCPSQMGFDCEASRRRGATQLVRTVALSAHARGGKNRGHGPDVLP
jgi:hypothetical protein